MSKILVADESVVGRKKSEDQECSTPTRAGDVMTRDVYTVCANEKMSAAVEKILENHVTGAPVVSGNGACVGVLSSKDLLDQGVKDYGDDKVAKYMTSPAVTVSEDHTLAEVASVFQTNSIHRVPVVDDHGRVVGIISPLDIDHANISRRDATVLLIDDDAYSLSILMDVATKNAMTPLIASNVQSGLDMAVKFKPNAIVIDLDISEVDYDEVLATLLWHANTHNIPVQTVSFTERKQGIFAETDRFLYNVQSTISPENLSQAGTGDVNPLDKESLRGKTILVVDDDKGIRYVLRYVLEERGAVVVLATHGKLAIDALNQYDSFDLIILDVDMPVMNGLAAMREIRQHELYSDVPILALSASDTDENKRACLDTGANEFTTKPVVLDKLVKLAIALVGKQ